jgi:hypothetical protein
MTRLPLPLQLTEPVLLAGDLDTQLHATYAREYDPKTQLCTGGGGGGGSNSFCHNSTKSYDKGLLVLDVKLDIQVDDLIG